MISPRPAVLRAVITKDLRLFWPFIAAIVALSLLAWVLEVTGLLNLNTAMSLWACGELAGGFLIIAVVQQDPPSSDTHDWLIRPIGKLEMLTAKALFIAFFTLLPLTIGYAAITLTSGESPLSVLRALAGDGLGLAVTVPAMMAFASLTRNIGLAIAAAIALLVVYIVLSVISLQSVVQGEPVRWLVSKPVSLIVLPLSLTTMWLAYDRREMAKARALFAAGLVVLMAVMSCIPASVLYAAEQAVAGNSTAAEPVKLAMAPGCFADARAREATPAWLSLTTKDGKRNEAVEKFAMNLAGPFAAMAWTPDELDRAGRSAVAFTTEVKASGVSSGESVVVDHVYGRFVDAAGRKVASPKIARRIGSTFHHDGQNDFEEAWLMSKSQALGLADAHFKLDYDLTLMRPMATSYLPADGQHHELPGLGDCSFKSVSGKTTVQLVECKLSSAAPAMTVSRISGSPAKHGQTNYTPQWLQLSGETYILDVAPSRLTDPTAPVPSASGVNLTTYAAVSHVHRQVLAPAGALGGPAAACPINR